MMMEVKAWLLFVLFPLALGGCAGHKAANTHGAYRHITWSEAKALIRECRAREVGQTHSRLVTLTLKKGGLRYTREPAIDDVLDVVNPAMHTCGPITFATE